MKRVKSLVLFLMFFGAIFHRAVAQNNNGDKVIEAFKKSIAAEEIEDYPKAIEYIQHLYKDLKNDYLINLRLGWLNYLNGNYQSSEKFYRDAIRISNQSIESLLGLAYPLYAIGKMDELIDIYKTILQKNPNSFQANYRLGLIYLNNKDYLNAKVLFERIYNNFPSNYTGNLYLGWTYYYLGSKQKAHKLFLNALISQPNDKSALEGYNLTK